MQMQFAFNGHLLTKIMKTQIKINIIILLIICCVTVAGSARNQRGQDEKGSQENTHSLLDSGEDEGSDDEATAIKPAEVSNSDSSIKQDPVAKNSKSNSRKFNLPSDYNKFEVPKILPIMRRVLAATLKADEATDELGSLNIKIDAKIRCIREIDEIGEEITVELDFTAKWLDSEILFGNKDVDPLEILSSSNFTAGTRSLDPTFLKLIWKPDIFIENVVSITRPELITKPIRLLYNPLGYIAFSTRVTIKMDCEMEFHYYPADTQLCTFKFRSYSYTTKDLNIKWDVATGGPYLLDGKDQSFDVKLDMLKSYYLIESEDEVYRILQFQISARRKLSFQIIQTYLPSTFFIIIAWVSFLVPATMIEARIGISMTTLLTLTSMFASVRENSPVVSYVKAIDVWMVACIFFVFLTLLEFTLLTWRRHLTSTARKKSMAEVSLRGNVKKYSFETPDLTDKADAIEFEVRNGRHASVAGSPIDKYLLGYREEDIEKYGFRAFSLLFLIFNVVYWPWLLLASEYFIWDVDPTYNAMQD